MRVFLLLALMRLVAAGECDAAVRLSVHPEYAAVEVFGRSIVYPDPTSMPPASLVGGPYDQFLHALAHPNRTVAPHPDSPYTFRWLSAIEFAIDGGFPGGGASFGAQLYSEHADTVASCRILDAFNGTYVGQ